MTLPKLTIAALILTVAFFFQVHAAPLQRFELEGNVSFILTSPDPFYYIITLVNKNDFNVTSVKGIHVNLTYPIDTSSLKAVDNYNKTVPPDVVFENSVKLTYTGNLPALGYGKIFLNAPMALQTPPPLPTTTTSSTTIPPTSLPSTTVPSTTTLPTSSPTPPPPNTLGNQSINDTDILENPVPEEQDLPLFYVATAVFLLLAAIAGVLSLIS